MNAAATNPAPRDRRRAVATGPALLGLICLLAAPTPARAGSASAGIQVTAAVVANCRATGPAGSLRCTAGSAVPRTTRIEGRSVSSAGSRITQTTDEALPEGGSAPSGYSGVVTVTVNY